MHTERFDLWKPEEYNYPMSYGFIPNIVSYVHNDKRVRPCMLVVPGGGYSVVSPTEGEIVAMEFYRKGYNAFVLTYTTNLLRKEPLKTQPMKDLSRAIRMIRKDAGSFYIDPKRFVICGFSAGGHLCGSVCVHYEDIEEENPELKQISNRPDAAILSYPVITSGTFAHTGSFEALLGDNCSEEELQYMSLEMHVTKNTPPCFIWQAREDESVPVENSYLFANACKKAGVAFSHHVFMKGGHGLSLANRQWADEEYGTHYTEEQTLKIVEKVKSNEILMTEEEKREFLVQFHSEDGNKKQVNEEVRVWPILAEQWLKGLFN